MGMREQGSQKPQRSTGISSNTALDDTIRQHLRGEARGADSTERADRLLQAIMYRAQFEVEQLPALVEGDNASPTDAEAVSAPPPAALMHREERPGNRNLSVHFNQYRELMDFKVFRILGACGGSLSMSR